MSETFAEKLAFVLKALSLSRARLGADLGVDKSVVSRWFSGVRAPSAHNLAAITALVARRAPGFTMLDWDLPLNALPARLGIAGAGEAELALADYVPPAILDEAISTTRMRGEAYEGFWRSTRPAIDPPGQFMHDQIMIRRDAGGVLRMRMGVYDMRFEGTILPIQTQLFCVAVDPSSGVFLFSIYNAVMRNRAEVLDGINLTCQRNQGGAPVAAAGLMERIGDLSGDPEADDMRFEALTRQNPFAPIDSIPADIRDHLYRDVGPSAFAAGGDPLLIMAFANSLSRGPLQVAPGSP